MKNPDIELKKARKKGRAIINEAKIKALSIIAQAYGEEIGKIAHEVALEFKNEALVEMARFKKELEDQIVTLETSTQKVVEAEYAEIKAEIEKYKASKIAQIDKTAHDILIDSSKRILGKAIDIRAHEDLVISALEDAKRQNLF